MRVNPHRNLDGNEIGFGGLGWAGGDLGGTRTRRGILERLGRGPATIGELAEPFGLTINGVKKHVGILEEVDLVVTAKVGRARECQLGRAQLEDATKWIDDYRRTSQRRLDRFGSYVDRTDSGR
jgi:DNA-binding transcriptional ArsR family regulator